MTARGLVTRRRVLAEHHVTLSNLDEARDHFARLDAELLALQTGPALQLVVRDCCGSRVVSTSPPWHCRQVAATAPSELLMTHSFEVDGSAVHCKTAINHGR